MTGSALLDSGKRFSVTMWEYSWMVQRSGRQAEYADWDTVLDELVDRGYDCIRIDAQPHVIAADNEGNIVDEVTFLPIADNFMWGNHEPVTVNPRQDLIGFMKKMKDRGIYAGLSCWFNDDAAHRKLMIKRPEDYARIWRETLDLLAQEDLLDIVVWVDICNEFPLPNWCPEPFRQITGADPKNMRAIISNWSDTGIETLNSYFNGAIGPLKQAYPDLKYTVSFQSFGEKNIMKGDFSSFDLLEPHIWATDNLKWAIKSKHMSAFRAPFPDGIVNHARTVQKLYPKKKEQIRGILAGRTAKWAAFSQEKKLPLVTTEAWTSVVYEDLSHYGFTGEWEWFMDVAEMGIREAIKNGWQGICTSNFSEPHFEGLWYEKDWHVEMNRLIKSS